MSMSLFFEDFHLELQKSVRRFAETELKPHAEELDEKQGFNHKALKKLGEMGLLGVTADEAHGGAGMGAIAATLVMEELGAACASTTLSYLAHSILAVNNLSQNASLEQKKKYLPKLCSGEWLGAMAMSEPGAGSEPGEIPRFLISVALAFLLCHGDQCPSKDVSTAAAN